jgi:hypothetical protein
MGPASPVSFYASINLPMALLHAGGPHFASWHLGILAAYRLSRLTLFPCIFLRLIMAHIGGDPIHIFQWALENLSPAEVVGSPVRLNARRTLASF